MGKMGECVGRAKLVSVARVAARGVVGLVLTGLTFAQNATTSSSSATIISQLCPLLKLLPIFGGVAMTSGIFLAAYNYMSTDQESRQKGKSGAEGLLIGAGLISIAPALVAQVMNIDVLGICPII